MRGKLWLDEGAMYSSYENSGTCLLGTIKHQRLKPVFERNEPHLALSLSPIGLNTILRKENSTLLASEWIRTGCYVRGWLGCLRTRPSTFIYGPAPPSFRPLPSLPYALQALTLTCSATGVVSSNSNCNNSHVLTCEMINTLFADNFFHNCTPTTTHLKLEDSSALSLSFIVNP